MSGKALPKIIEKSPAEIESAVAAIEASNLPPELKEFAVSCVRLAVFGYLMHCLAIRLRSRIDANWFLANVIKITVAVTGQKRIRINRRKKNREQLALIQTPMRALLVTS